MSAACSQCLMRVDGIPNLYTCQVPARAGMRLERQNAYPTAKVDIFGAIDFLFPRGLDHHEMFAGVPVAEQVMAKVARHLAGLGLLPERAPPERAPAETLTTRVAIVGGGAAGSNAAETLARRGVPYFLCERDEVLGGRLLLGAGAPVLAVGANARVRTRASAFGLYADQAGRYLAVVGVTPEGPRLTKVYSERFLLAPGGHASVLPFENNDLPGVYSGKAAGVLLARHGLVAGEQVALVGHGGDLYALARQFEAAGSKVVAVVDLRGVPPADAPEHACHGTVLKAFGHAKGRVSGLGFQVSGKQRKVPCDAIIVCLPSSPSFELARQGGARVSWSAGMDSFVVEADAEGRTSGSGVFVAGDVLGERSAEAAAASGQRTADFIASELA